MKTDDEFLSSLLTNERFRAKVTQELLVPMGVHNVEHPYPDKVYEAAPGLHLHDALCSAVSLVALALKLREEQS